MSLRHRNKKKWTISMSKFVGPMYQVGARSYKPR